jgi:putative addiction module antidote
MIKLEVSRVGDAVSVVLPEEVLAKLRVGEGDTLYAIETLNGVELRTYDAEVARQLEIAEGVMREDREVLRRLAG